MKILDPRVFESIFNDNGKGLTGVKAVLDTLHEGLRRHAAGEKNGLAPNQVSIKGLAYAFGLLDKYDLEGSFQKLVNGCKSMDPEKVSMESVLSESNPGLMTNAFQIAVGALLSAMVIEGYKDDEGYIADKLVTVVPSKRRNQKLHGFTALGGPAEVAEGHPYSETDFSEKWVSTQETKKGRILSLSEELLLLDQTGQIGQLARDLGYWIRQEREKTIVRGVQDADNAKGIYAFRPSGVAEALYATDGSNQNYIGSGGVSPFNAAMALEDWTDVDAVLDYRNTMIVDDRIDGTPEPIAGLNGPRNILLVPGKKKSTAWYIKHATDGRIVTNTNNQTNFQGSPVSGDIGEILSSPYVDAVSRDDWYYGDFKRQFMWMEIWPVQTFVQGADSESGFERDTGLRVKCRYFAGLAARDTVFCTKIDGA